MNKTVQNAKFNSRKQHVFAGNFAINVNIFAVPSCKEVY